MATELIFFDNGNQNIDLTGGWIGGITDGDGGAEYAIGDTLQLQCNGSDNENRGAAICTQKTIDVTPLKTIKFHARYGGEAGDYNYGLSSTDQYDTIYVKKGMNDLSQSGLTGEKTFEIDVSQMTGSYKIKVSVYESSKATMKMSTGRYYKIWGEYIVDPNAPSVDYYNEGDQNELVTGGWEQWTYERGSGGQDAYVIFEGNRINLYSKSATKLDDDWEYSHRIGKSRAYTKKPIDVTKLKTIDVDFTTTRDGSATFFLTTAPTTENTNMAVNIKNSGQVDVSHLSGEYYLAIECYADPPSESVREVSANVYFTKCVGNFKVLQPYEITVPDTPGRTIQARVQGIDSAGDKTEWVEGETKTIIYSTPPQISGENGDLGKVSEALIYKYTVTDEEDKTVTVKEELNGVELRTYTAQSGAENQLTIAGEDFVKLAMGGHRLTITATDSEGATETRSLTFEKVITGFTITLKEPFEADVMPTRCAIKVFREIPFGSVFKVEACNNPFDTVPKWEDITDSVLAAHAYVFANKEDFALKHGLNVRVTVERKSDLGECWVGGIGGNFE